MTPATGLERFDECIQIRAIHEHPRFDGVPAPDYFVCRLYDQTALTFSRHAGRMNEDEYDGRCERRHLRRPVAGTLSTFGPRGRRSRPDPDVVFEARDRGLRGQRPNGSSVDVESSGRRVRRTLMTVRQAPGRLSEDDQLGRATGALRLARGHADRSARPSTSLLALASNKFEHRL